MIKRHKIKPIATKDIFVIYAFVFRQMRMKVTRNVNMKCMFFNKFQFVHEVVIGAPYSVTADLMDHFGVQVVCHGLTPIAPDADGSDPYKVPKQRACFKVNKTLSNAT